MVFGGQHQHMVMGVFRSRPVVWTSSIKSIGPNALAFGLWGVFALSHVVLLARIGGSPILLSYTVVWATSGLLLTLVLQRFIDFSNPLPLGPRWLVTVTATLVFAATQTAMDEMLARAITPAVLAIFRPDMLVAEFLFRNGHSVRPVGVEITAWIYFWVFACYATAATLLTTQRRLAKAEASARDAQLAALRFQINPHFLFNALNAVSSLSALGRTREAEAATQALADFMRASLETQPSQFVTLAEEIDAAAAYLKIEEVRFGDRLTVAFEIEEALHDEPVPPLILQPLVENAVKHGFACTDGPMVVSVSAEKQNGWLILTVENSGRLKTSAYPTQGTKVGMANIRARLKSLYRGAAALEAEPTVQGYVARLKLPLA